MTEAAGRFGEPDLVEWAEITGKPGDTKLVGKGATLISGTYGFLEDIGNGRPTGRYIVAAQGQFSVIPLPGASPVAAKTVVLVLHGVTDSGAPVPYAIARAYRQSVHLNLDGTRVYAPVGLMPVQHPGASKTPTLL